MCYLHKVMLLHRYISLSIVFTAISICSSLFAQLNLGVGFSAASISAAENNVILQDYNVSNQDRIEQAYPDLKLMTGVFVSLRYKLERVSFEVAWENLERDINSVLVFDDKTGQVNNLYYNLTSSSLGVENHIHQFGYGAALSSRVFTIKSDILNTDFKRKIDREREFSAKFYLTYTVQQSRIISLQLKPFVHIPLGSYSLTGLQDELQSTNASLDKTISPFLFGLTLVFYNGPH